MVNNMKFKNKETGVIVVARNMFEENILKSNTNYMVFKEVEEKADTVEKKTKKSAKKGGK